MSPDSSQALLDRIAAALAPVAGIRAVVLGGSRGRGVAQPGSDYDIGIYYSGALDVAALEAVARTLDSTGRTPLVTPLGGWGAWVDGGGWLTIDGEAVDLLYRNLERVDGVIDEVLRGEFRCAYHYGHPHAFVSHMYAGEIATCRALHDRQGLVAARKARLTPYPPALRDAVIARFGDEGRFFLLVARKSAARGDISHVAGCVFRAASCLLQMVFARNGKWLLNEKGALALAGTFARTPKDLRLRSESAFADLANGPEGLTRALGTIGDLIDEAAA